MYLRAIAKIKTTSTSKIGVIRSDGSEVAFIPSLLEDGITSGSITISISKAT